MGSGIDTNRLAVQPPSKPDMNAWKQSTLNAHTQLEHLNLRAENLELLQTYGTNAWRVYNETLENLLKRMTSQLNGVNKEIESVNQERKEEQTSAGQVVRNLESKWIELVHKNRDIAIASAHLQADIDRLKQNQKENGSSHPTTDNNNNSKQ